MIKEKGVWREKQNGGRRARRCEGAEGLGKGKECKREVMTSEKEG